jgi:hypothetical protein
MKKLCSLNNLLKCEDFLVRVPFLVKGNLVTPPVITRSQIESAFKQFDGKNTCIHLAGAQVLREPIIDRDTMRYTGDYIYQIMPQVNAPDLIETDFDKLASGLYSLNVEDILCYLENILDTILGSSRLLENILETLRLTSDLPDAFLCEWAASLTSSFDRQTALHIIDSELSYMGQPGSTFLDGWVEAYSDNGDREKPCIRAMPTRQLHITAGNAPEVPVVSILRAVLTKSAAVIKLPYGATLTGALLSLAAAAGAPDHPITKNLSIVYWPGGDESIENVLFGPHSFDRIVIWGSPDAVSSVRSRTPFTKVTSFDPRYGVSLIGREAFENDIEGAVERTASDIMMYNQKACTSSLVQYVEGSLEQAEHFAKLLAAALEQHNIKAPGFTPPSATGQIKRMRRGKYAAGTWYINNYMGNYSSGIMVIPGEFDILDHPMCRLAIVRPVSSLDYALKYMSQNVSTAGVYPENRRLALRDRILARGVSNVLPLGECGKAYPGMPHDGVLALNELVDWKIG